MNYYGRSHIICNTFVTGPKEECTNSLLIHSILLTVALFWLTTIFPYFWPSPVCYINLILLSLTWTSLFLCQFTDPGIIPRGHEEPLGNKTDFYSARFCYTCNIMRPPKATHCRVCDNCVKHFDHHCALVNNCIGFRNIKFFIGFLLFSFTYALYSLSLIHI